MASTLMARPHRGYRLTKQAVTKKMVTAPSRQRWYASLAVVAEVAQLSMTASRRLQLAAEGSGVTGIVLRR
jgi:hypothetical protein